jgi:hypothetical protein
MSNTWTLGAPDFNAFLRKPINFDDLCRTILDVIRR